MVDANVSETANLLLDKHRLHFIGIGGSGMFPLVQILLEKGFVITGSDNNDSDIVKMERALGIPVVIGQRAENIKDADLIVYTSAVMDDNPELIAAKQSGIPTVERSILLGYITSLYTDCICVCGTHGKTTATSMLTQILLDAGKDPSAVIGGKLKSINAYGRVGGSSILACESCEFANHFRVLSPNIAVLLNIDNDHLDYYGTMQNLKAAFLSFCQKADKVLIYRGDEPNASEVASRVLGIKKISFGASKQNDYYPTNIRHPSGMNTCFTLCHRGEPLAELSLFVPGEHNILNAIAACAAAMEVGVAAHELKKGLANFKGAGRRFEFIGEKDGVTIVDDYAHHPTEIAATLRAAKKLPFRQVWALHQPFTYSRTKLLLNEFASALRTADHVVLTEIMGGREKNTEGVFAQDLADKLDGCRVFATQRQAADYVMAQAKPGDLVITLGCGDIYKAAKMMAFGRYE